MVTAILAVVAAAAVVGVVILERIRRQHVRDITRAAVRVRIGHVLAEGLVAGEAIHDVLRLLLPDHADWCLLHLAEAGRVRRVEVVHADPQLEQLMREAFERLPFAIDVPANWSRSSVQRCSKNSRIGISFAGRGSAPSSAFPSRRVLARSAP